MMVVLLTTHSLIHSFITGEEDTVGEELEDFTRAEEKSSSDSRGAKGGDRGMCM